MTKDVMEKSLNKIYESIIDSSNYQRSALQGVLELIEKSESGTKDAEVSIEINPAYDPNPFSPSSLNKFDRLQFNTLKTCINMLGDYGEIKLLPYSQGIMEGRKCMTLVFTTKL
ncbi:MAG: hypothetical protein ACLFNO_02595 [Parcubacteria group bacterium]